MAKKGKQLAKVDPESLPMVSPELRKKIVTPARMSKFVAQAMAAYLPHLVPEALDQIRIGTMTGNPGMIEKVLKMYGLLQTGPGTVINNNNIANANANAAAAVRTGKNFDSIIRELSTSDSEVIAAQAQT